MRLLDFASVKLCGFLILGILLGFYFDIPIRFSAILLGILVVFLIGSYIKQTRHGFPFFDFFALLTVVAIGVLVTALDQPKNWATHYSKISSAKSQHYHLKITEVLKPTVHSSRYFAEVIAVDATPASGRLLLRQNLDSIGRRSLRVDDELVFYVMPVPIAPPKNPHQFDYQDYLKKQGVYHQILLKQGGFHTLKKTSPTIFGFAHDLRQSVVSALKNEKFGHEELSIIQALLLGQKNDISTATYNNYKNAGAVHILAVSGLHIGILLLLLQFLFKPLEKFPKGRTLKLIAIVFMLWAYALLAGLSPSIVRAVTMFSFLAYAMHLNRPVNTFNILALSMLFILLVQPLFLFQVGFQMSYAAVFAILWIYPKLQQLWSPKPVFLRKMWQLLGVSLAAQLGVLPISLFYFHQFPALFFISNLVVVPFLGIILGMGILVIILAQLNALPNFLVKSYDFLIQNMNGVIEWVANQEAFVFKNISFDVVQLPLAYFIIISAALMLSKARYKYGALLLIGILLMQSYGILNKTEAGKKEQLILAHQTANSVLLYHQNGNLHVMGPKSEATLRLTRDFSVGEQIDSVVYSPLQNIYTIKKRKLLVVDSIGAYPFIADLDYLLLTQSPKINLERLLDSLRPKVVLADGSNYISYAQRWKSTCQDKKIPFHHTGEKGAYYFDLGSY